MYVFKGASAGEHGLSLMIYGYAILTLFLVLGIYYIGKVYSAYRKASKTEKILDVISKADSFWDVGEMKSHTFDLYHKMQTAWTKRDLDPVKSELTPELIVNLQNLLDDMKAKNEINMLYFVYIDEVKIIGCEDYLDNNRDSFTALITGTVQDYIINEVTQKLITNVNKKLEEYNETYHFIRKDNKWLLNEMHNHVGIRNILRAKDFTEK
ncbi:MAG: TIM44-like domain-containing protein [Bacteroidales bacterium]|nr:TIM44-like domain-containing protein [Bacteroidales bacterium]